MQMSRKPVCFGKERQGERYICLALEEHIYIIGVVLLGHGPELGRRRFELFRADSVTYNRHTGSNSNGMS